jgi:phosphoribosylformylglycinamidine cyclo-ligase
MLPEQTQAVIDRDSWQRPAVFSWLKRQGRISDQEMHRVFNCGIGMVVVVAADQAEAAAALLRDHGEGVSRIGVLEATEGEAGVRVDHLGPAWPA